MPLPQTGWIVGIRCTECNAEPSHAEVQDAAVERSMRMAEADAYKAHREEKGCKAPPRPFRIREAS